MLLCHYVQEIEAGGLRDHTLAATRRIEALIYRLLMRGPRLSRWQGLQR